jgi:hypothetical protein
MALLGDEVDAEFFLPSVEPAWRAISENERNPFE